MKKTLSVIALLLSLLVVMSFGALSAYAEGSETDTVEESSAASVDSSEDGSSDETSDTTSDETSDTTSEDAGDTTSEAESTEDASTDASDGSDEVSADESSTAADSDSNDNNSSSSFPWALTIFGAIVVIVAIVCFVSVKLNNKLGRWLKVFFRDYKSEIKKVTWPSKDITIKSTIVVIVCLVVSGIVIGLLDFGLAKLIELFRDLVSK